MLLGRAGSLRDVLRIEDEITRRRADLDSLLQQQTYLRDQTSLATITVTIQRTAPRPVPAATGFVGGLVHGWHAFTGFLGGVATALGAVLPFTLLGLVVVPLLWWVRRWARRRGPVVEAAQPTS